MIGNFLYVNLISDFLVNQRRWAIFQNPHSIAFHLGPIHESRYPVVIFKDDGTVAYKVRKFKRLKDALMKAAAE